MIKLDLEIAYLLRKFLEKNIFKLGTKKKVNYIYMFN